MAAPFSPTIDRYGVDTPETLAVLHRANLIANARYSQRHAYNGQEPSWYAREVIAIEANFPELAYQLHGFD